MSGDVCIALVPSAFELFILKKNWTVISTNYFLRCLLSSNLLLLFTGTVRMHRSGELHTSFS